METNIHIFGYSEEQGLLPIFIRIFVNGVEVFHGSDVSALSIQYLFNREVNLRDIESFRYSHVPLEHFLADNDRPYMDMREEYPESEQVFKRLEGTNEN